MHPGGWDYKCMAEIVLLSTSLLAGTAGGCGDMASMGPKSDRGMGFLPQDDNPPAYSRGILRARRMEFDSKAPALIEPETMKLFQTYRIALIALFSTQSGHIFLVPFGTSSTLSSPKGEGFQPSPKGTLNVRDNRYDKNNLTGSGIQVRFTGRRSNGGHRRWGPWRR